MKLIRKMKKWWRTQPLLSVATALLLLVIVQTMVMTFDFTLAFAPEFAFDVKLKAFDSVSAWWQKWTTNWRNILLNNSYVGMIALAMTFVIISGGIDLSVGSTLVAVGAAVMVIINTKEAGILTQLGITGVPAVVIGVALGLLLGFLLGQLNGIVIAKGKVPPFIVTLGTMMIFLSVTQYFMQTRKGAALPTAFKNISKFQLGGNMILPIIYWLVLAVILYIVAKHTVFGRHVYAVGSNERTARLSGINVDRVKRRVYALTGVIVAFAAMVQVARIGSMDYASAGSGYEMDAIASVIIGGTAMAGGSGSIIGTLLGTLTLAVMNNLLTLMGVDPFLREAFKGAIVVAAVLLQRKEK